MQNGAVPWVTVKGAGVEFSRLVVEVVAMDIIDAAVAVVVHSVFGNLSGIAIDITPEVIGENEVSIVNDVQSSLSGQTKFFPDLISFQFLDIPGEVLQGRLFRKAQGRLRLIFR